MLGAPLLIAVWLAEALRWYQRRGQLLLDGEGGFGGGGNLVGANLGDAIWWTLIVLVLWALPLGVLGAAGLAALVQEPARFAGQTIGTVICGMPFW